MRTLRGGFPVSTSALSEVTNPSSNGVAARSLLDRSKVRRVVRHMAAVTGSEPKDVILLLDRSRLLRPPRSSQRSPAPPTCTRTCVRARVCACACAIGRTRIRKCVATCLISFEPRRNVWNAVLDRPKTNGGTRGRALRRTSNSARLLASRLCVRA